MNQQERNEIADAVFQIVKHIPYGRATSYGAIARAVGYPNMSRLVGKIMSEVADSAIPAHRVLNSQGCLSAKAAFAHKGGLQALLEAEGISVRKDRVCDWKSVFWNPVDEIGLDVKDTIK